MTRRRLYGAAAIVASREAGGDQVMTVSKKVRMSELTGGEAREAYARRPVVLLPMGSHEDQGPHAPMGDWLLADKMTELIAKRASERGTETYMAPTLPFGGADYFGHMPGGIALSQSTLRAVITDMLDCLVRHDITRLIVINGHGGNVQAIHDACQAVYRARKVLIPSLYIWRIVNAPLTKILGADAVKQRVGHGADPLTSLYMHFFPDLVRPDMIPEPRPLPKVLGMPVTGFPTASFEGSEVGIPVELDEMAPNGVRAGDPRLCSAETGAALAEALTEIGARFVRYYAEHTN
jgi:creatinine amidohydrolase